MTAADHVGAVLCLLVIPVALLVAWLAARLNRVDEPPPPKPSPSSPEKAAASAQQLCDDHPAAKPPRPFNELNLAQLARALADLERVDSCAEIQKRADRSESMRNELVRRLTELERAAATPKRAGAFVLPFSPTRAEL